MFADKKSLRNRHVDSELITLHAQDQESIHAHHFYEVLFCIRGQMVCQVEDKRYQIQPGDLISISPGEMHHLTTSLYKECEFYLLHVNLDLTDQYKNLWPEIRVRYKENSHTLIHTSETPYATLGDVFQQIYQEELKQAFGWEAMMYAYETKIITAVVRIHKEGISAYGKNLKSSKLDRIIRYINGHLEEELSVSVIANAFFLSESYINKLFHNHLGISPHRFIIKKRMAKAEKLLLAGDSIQDILPLVGYQDYSAFFRAFKQEYHTTPSEYKKSILECYTVNVQIPATTE